MTSDGLPMVVEAVKTAVVVAVSIAGSTVVIMAVVGVAEAVIGGCLGGGSDQGWSWRRR